MLGGTLLLFFIIYHGKFRDRSHKTSWKAFHGLSADSALPFEEDSPNDTEAREDAQTLALLAPL